MGRFIGGDPLERAAFSLVGKKRTIFLGRIVGSPKELAEYHPARLLPIARKKSHFGFLLSLVRYYYRFFSGLPREATEIARDTWVAMDSCCRGQMGVEVSPNRQIRKSWFRQVSHSTHPYGRPKGLVLGSEIPDDETSLFMSPNGIG